MNEYIAYCGLDCESCEARLATLNNDNALRQRVAKEWSELNGVEITRTVIPCAQSGSAPWENRWRCVADVWK